MKKVLLNTCLAGACLTLLACGSTSSTDLSLDTSSDLVRKKSETPYTVNKNGNQFQIKHSGTTYFQTPKDGHFVIGTAMTDGWPSQWASEDSAISCTLLTDAKPCPENTDIKIDQPIELKTTLHPQSGKSLEVSEVLNYDHGVVKAVRSWYWPGSGTLTGLTLSASWNVNGAVDSPITLPGSMLYGNPHSGKYPWQENDEVISEPLPGGRPAHMGRSASDITYLEEHRVASPFVSTEWADGGKSTRGAALHVAPSMVLDSKGNGIGNSLTYRKMFAEQPYDQWWSLGASSHTGLKQTSDGEGTVLGLLSGPTAKNRTKGVVNSGEDGSATDGVAKNYQTDLSLPPETKVEKTYYLEAIPNTSPGWSFSESLKTAMDIAQFKYEPTAYWHGDSAKAEHPGLQKLASLLQYAFTQWTGYGFAWAHNNEVALGWASQSEIPPYAIFGLYDFSQLNWNSIVPAFIKEGTSSSKQEQAFNLAVLQLDRIANDTLFTDNIEYWESDGYHVKEATVIGTIDAFSAKNDTNGDNLNNVRSFTTAFGAENEGALPLANQSGFLNRSQGIDNVARTIEAFEARSRSAGFGKPENSALASAQSRDLPRWKLWLSFASTALMRQIETTTTSEAKSIPPEWLDGGNLSGFMYGVSPLLRAYRMLPNDPNRDAWKTVALNLAAAYKDRYGDGRHIYWGGTSDCSCEDKEGAWGAAQAFIAARDYYQNQLDTQNYGGATKQELSDLRDAFHKASLHALFITHTYTYIWNVKMPPGRTLAKDFDTRGLTLVSVGHIHIDGLGARYADEFRSFASELGNKSMWTAVSKSLLAGALQLQDPRFIASADSDTQKQFTYAGGIAEQFFPSNWCYWCDIKDIPDSPFTWRGEITKGYAPFWPVGHVLGTFTQMRLGGIDPVNFLETPTDPWAQ